LKNRKWLLITVLVVLIINITFFVLVRLAGVDKIVQQKFSAALSKTLRAKVQIGSFTFNDKQLKVTGLQLENPGIFELEIKQLYVQYNLPQLLLSNFKNLHSIKHIDIYDPILQLNIEPSGEKKKSSGFKIPDISSYFEKLTINNATVSVNYSSNKIKIEENWSNLHLKIKNTKKSLITLNSGNASQDTVHVVVKLNSGTIEEARFDIGKLSLDKLHVPAISEAGFSLDLSGEFKDNLLSYKGGINNITASVADRAVTSKQLSFSGNDKKIITKFEELVLDGNEISAEFEIKDFLSAERNIHGSVSTYDVELNQYFDKISGLANTDIKINGLISDPIVEVEVRSDSIFAYDQSLLNADIEAVYQNKKANIELINANWLQNEITGNGTYSTNGNMEFNLFSEDLIWEENAHGISGDLTCKISRNDALLIDLEMNDLVYSNNDLELSDLKLNAQMADKDFIARLSNEREDLIINLNGSLDPKEAQASIELKRFDLGPIFSTTSLPMLSGELEIQANEFSIIVNSSLRAYDKKYGKLSGRLATNIALNLVDKTSLINMRTHNAKFNYEEFSMNLLAQGTLDSIRTTKFTINNNLDIDGWFSLKPDFNYGVKLSGDDIKIKEFAQYFMSYYTYSEIKGSTSFDLEYDSRNKGAATGYIALDQFTIGDFKKFDSEIFLTGNNEKITLQNSYVCCDSTKLLDLNSEIILKPDFEIQAKGKLNTLSLEDIFPDDKIRGIIDGEFFFYNGNGRSRLTADFNAEKFRANKLKFDKIRFSFTQEDSLLIIDELTAKRGTQFDFNSSGAIGFNLLNSNSYPDSNRISMKFKGDLFSFLNKQSKAIRYGESDCEFEMTVGMGENGLSIDKGFFELLDGSMNIQDQPNRIDKCNINFKIADDRLSLNEFKLNVGEGTLYIENEIMQNDTDFRLGMLNLGKFKVYTSQEGLQIYMPKYTPANTMVNASIAGRNSDYMEITGPFDDLKILGDITVSNGDLIYPPDTENLLKLFNTVTEVKEPESDPVVLPLSFDLMLHLGENVRYVTYPVDIKLKPAGYLHLEYLEGEFQKPEALFIADEGSVDMFGTTLILDYMQVDLTKLGKGVNIAGTFYKKTSDGSLITLEIFNDDSVDKGSSNLRFELLSDNPNDLITDILSKLRYNRSMNEISPAQRKTLLQDEVIQIAGLGLESAVLDPLISPVENTIRKFFRFDYFHMQTDLVQNLFASYSSENKLDYITSEEQIQIDKFTSELFLNNLSISAGKYLTRKVFIDYEARFEKQSENLDETTLGVFQDFTIRYDLPWKLKISYIFRILPFDVENQHQIMLERSFKF